jgi:hypothetical protein
MSAKVHLFLFILFIAVLVSNFGLNSNNSSKLSGSISPFSDSGFDSLEVVKNIIGEWIWDSTCCEKKKTVCFAGLYYKIRFMKNFDLKVYENGELVKTAKWALFKKDKNYSVVSIPPVEYVSGEVTFTRNSIKLNDGNSQGNNYYFSKHMNYKQLTQN